MISLSGFTYFIKIVSQFIISKFFAVIIGPAGLALLGQLSNVVSILQSIATGGISLGVTKYVSEYSDNLEKQDEIIRNALKLVLYSSVIISSCIFLFYKEISSFVFFKSLEFQNVIFFLGISILPFSLSSILLSIINGKKHYKLYLTINLFNSIVNLLFTLIAVKLWGLKGALYSIVLGPILFYIVTFYFGQKYNFNIHAFKKKNFDKDIISKFSKFSFMAINNAIVGSIGLMVIRSSIVKYCSLEQAGYWDSLNKISTSYMLLLTSSIQVYFLPTLSSIKCNKLFWRELLRMNKLLIPSVFIGLIFLYLFRDNLILLLFSREFLPIKSYFALQFISDLFKISSSIFAYTLYARAQALRIILTDTFFTVTYIAIIHLLIPHFELEGIYLAYLINSVIYFLFMVYYVRRYLFPKHV